jgi:hypothetical protein
VIVGIDILANETSVFAAIHSKNQCASIDMH